MVLLVPSLFLGISFVIMMGALHRYAPLERRIWSQTGLTFAIVYGTLICMSYFEPKEAGHHEPMGPQ